MLTTKNLFIKTQHHKSLSTRMSYQLLTWNSSPFTYQTDGDSVLNRIVYRSVKHCCSQ